MSEFLPTLRRLPMIILVVLLLISAGCQALDKQNTFDPVSSSTESAAKGAQAPYFTLTDLNGDEVSLGDLRGQPVLINFWATW
jgi:cytochrome oxidase Cu insertion factor (SCO1/SenC/PrrC family)